MDPSMLAAIRRLPERQREVIAFRILLGLSSSEAAHELELSVGAVGTHLHRALNALRISLGDNNEGIAK
jgi:RNA polymerase sigma-70 factor (ECF subfamily)